MAKVGLLDESGERRTKGREQQVFGRFFVRCGVNVREGYCRCSR